MELILYCGFIETNYLSLIPTQRLPKRGLRGSTKKTGKDVFNPFTFSNIMTKFLVIYSLGSYDHHSAMVAYKDKADAEKFKNDLLADGCEAIVRESTREQLPAYNL